MANNPNGTRGVLDHLGQYGVPKALVEQINAGFMRQEDYTRKTQEIAVEREKLAFGLGQMTAQQQQQGGAPQNEFEKLMGRFDPEQHGPAIELLREALTAFKKDMMQELGPQLQQVQLGMRRQDWSREVEAAFAEELVPRYGRKALEKLEAVKAEAISRASKGIGVKPGALFVEMFPDDALKLRQGQQTAERQKHDAQHMEGFHELTSTEESPLDDGQGPARTAADKTRPLDSAKAADDIVAAISRKRAAGEPSGVFE
jgi:hypothetical protein